MSGEDQHTAGRSDCGANAAAYALGALDAHEAQAFRRHLSRCAICQDELSAFAQVTDALALSAPQLDPPRGLRSRVRRTVRAEARAHAASRRSRPSRAPRAISTPSYRALAVSAVAAVVAAVGGVVIATRSSTPVRVIRASVIGSPGSAELRLAGGGGELRVSHLPPPPAGRIYEVWVKRRNRPLTPTRALFSVTSGGAADVDVPGSLHGVSAVMVTQEPEGGSLTPTHPPLIVARLS